MLVKIIGDMSDLYKSLDDSEKAAKSSSDKIEKQLSFKPKWDTATFKNALSETQGQIQTMANILAKSSESITEAFRRIDGEASVWGNSTDLIAQKQAALKAEISSLIAEGVDPLSPRIERLQEQYFKLGDESVTLAKKQSTLGGQLKDIDKMLGGVGQKLLTLLANPLVLAAAAIVAVTKAAFDSVKQLALYGDEISDLSDQTGISTTALQEYKFVAEQTGGTLGQVTNAVKLMTRGLDTNADTFAKLGVRLKDSSGNFRSQNEIFDDTIAALGGITNETERSKIALQLFGRDALAMVPLLKLGAGGLKSLKDEAHNLGVVMSEETVKKAGDLKDSTDALKLSWKAFSMGLTQDSVPALLTISNAIKRIIGDMNEQRRIAAIQKKEEADRTTSEKIALETKQYSDLLELRDKLAKRDKESAEALQPQIDAQQKKIMALSEQARWEERIAAKKAKDDAALSESDRKEKERLDELRAARDVAAKEYNDSIKTTRQLEAAGLRTTEQAQEEVIAATKKYAEALVPIVAASGNAKIGALALAKALRDIKPIREWTGELEDAIEPLNNLAIGVKEWGGELEDQIEPTNKIAIGVREWTGELEDNIVATKDWEAETKKAVKKIIDTYDRYFSYVSDIFSSISDITANNADKELSELEKQYDKKRELIENDGKTKRQVLEDELAAALSAGDTELAAEKQKNIDLLDAETQYNKERAKIQYQADLVEWESNTLQVVGESAMAAIKAWADYGPVVGALATAAGVLATAAVASSKPVAPSLASGGHGSSPTIATVFDNKKYEEMVAPLSPEFFDRLGNGLYNALASRSRSSDETTTASSGSRSGLITMGSIDADDIAERVAEKIGPLAVTVPLSLDGDIVAESTARRFRNNPTYLKRK